MPGFANIGRYARSFAEGRWHTSHCRKIPSQASTAGWWVDLSMAGGNPLANYYASSPLTAATLTGSRGIFHGDDKAPASKHLAGMTLCTPTAGLVGEYKLLDYLLYYPFVDGDAAGDQQDCDNSVTLPRYTDGDGVRAMLVATAPTAGGGVFTFEYVDQAGVTQTSPAITVGATASNISNLPTSQQGTAGCPGAPFLPLASGSTGIRRINWVNFSVAMGGNAALVLVRPLATSQIFEVNTPHEDFAVMSGYTMPRIYDGAYLGLIMNCAATVAAGTLIGRFDFVWSES